jgi:hypothetical protein
VVRVRARVGVISSRGASRASSKKHSQKEGAAADGRAAPSFSVHCVTWVHMGLFLDACGCSLNAPGCSLNACGCSLGSVRVEEDGLGAGFGCGGG